MTVAAERVSARSRPLAPAVPASTEALRVGPVAIRVSGSDGRLVEACARLRLGFAPPAKQPAELSTATVTLDHHRQRAPHLPRDVTPFAYDASGDVYVRANARVHIELRLDGSHVCLTAGVRPGERTGGHFPRHLLGIATAVAAVQADALLVHGCAMVSPRGETYLFMGASGDGKTTMTRRLPGWTALADDSVLLEGADDEDHVWVSGTPFAGSEELPRWGERHRLTRVVVLEPRSPTLSLTPLSTAECFTAILQRVFCPLVDGPVPERAVALADRLSQRVGGARLASNLGHDVTSIFAVRPGEAS